MKQTLKKSLALVLATLILLTAAPLSGFVGLQLPALDLGSIFSSTAAAVSNISSGDATDDIIASGTCGENLTWTLDSDGTLTISGEGAMTNYLVSFFAPWYSNSSSIKNVVIADSVTSIGEVAFVDCTSLTDINVAASNANYSALDGVLYNKNQTTLICYPAGKQATSFVIPDSVTSIGDSAFDYCTALTSVTIPDSVTSIGDGAFAGCTALTSVTIPDSVTSIGDSAFYWCTSLTSVTIGDSVTSIGDGAFRDCTSLTSVTIPNSVTSIGNSAFSYCYSLTSVTIPNSVTSIGSYAFYNTAYYNDETNWLNGVLYINNHLIRAKSYTSEEYTIKDGTKTIAGSAFYWRTSLTSVTIPDSVTSIGSSAFYDCYSLTSVTIGNSVTSIGDDAFYNCASLTDVYYTGSEEEWNAISIGSDNEPLLNATMHFDDHLESSFIDSETVFVTDDGNIVGLVGTTAEELLAQAEDGAILVDKNSNTLTADDKVGTGAIVTLADGTEFVIVVPGDINGDGEISTSDARTVLRMAVNLESLDGVYLTAAKVTAAEQITTAHARSILRASVGLEEPINWINNYAA